MHVYIYRHYNILRMMYKILVWEVIKRNDTRDILYEFH
jgi:hypothetical protein